MTGPTPQDVVRHMRDHVFTVPERFTQGQAARDARGRGTNAADQDATCWCLLGGIDLACSVMLPEGDGDRLFERVEELLAVTIDPEDGAFDPAHTVITFNDAQGRTVGDIVDLLDRALAV